MALSVLFPILGGCRVWSSVHHIPKFEFGTAGRISDPRRGWLRSSYSKHRKKSLSSIMNTINQIGISRSWLLRQSTLMNKN